MAIVDIQGNTLSLQSPSIPTNPNADLAIKAPVRVATTGSNITLSGQQTIDGVALNVGDRVLVKDQTDQTTNGLYNVQTGPWTRTIDANNNSQWAQGLTLFSAQGTTSADKQWTLTTANPVILGTSLIAFIQPSLPGNLLISVATTPPSSISTASSFATAFQCDLSKLNLGIGTEITGTATLGQPATGYMQTPNLSAVFTYFSNSSGWNQDTSDNGGRTGAIAFYTKVDQLGQGDATAYFGNVLVNSARAGATNFLANPAGQIFAGQILAGQSGVFLQGIGDINLQDEGFDVAAIAFEANLFRTVATGALGATWMGMRIQSVGTASADAGFSLSGDYTIGLDLVDGTYGTSQAAVAMGANQRIYLNSTVGVDNYPQNVTLGTTYLFYSSSNQGIQGVVSNAPAFIFQGAGGTSSIFSPLKMNGSTSGASTLTVSATGGALGISSGQTSTVTTLNVNDTVAAGVVNQQVSNNSSANSSAVQLSLVTGVSNASLSLLVGNGSASPFAEIVWGSGVANGLSFINNATTVAIMANGLQVGATPTGGDKGAGTINVATNIYLNNSAYTNPDFVFEHFYTGKIERFATSPGAAGYTGLMPLRELRRYTQSHLRLPGIDDEPAGVVERFDIALTKIEELTLYIMELEDRIASLN